MNDDDTIDRRRAAEHEAGHATVAGILCWKLGKSQSIPLPEAINEITELELGTVEANLQRTETSDPTLEKTWVGSTTYARMDLNELDKAMICVAGFVAEHLVDDDDISSGEIVESWEWQISEPSDTDYSGIPDSWEVRRTAVEQALQLLKGHRTLFDLVVRELERNELITNGQLKALIANQN